MSKSKILSTAGLFFLSCFSFLQAGPGVIKVDFLSRYCLEVNGAGPLLVTKDAARDRIILVNTNTSSVSLIDGKDFSVVNIPTAGRVPQYLKSEAMTVDSKTGNIYIIGNKCLHIIFPDKGTAVTVDTGEQYEMAAINEQDGTAFLVGRASKFLAMVPMDSKKIKRIPWVEYIERMQNLNQTPPPPIRKVVCDHSRQEIAAIDGFTSTLYLFSVKSGKLLKKRKLPVNGGARWHMAGFNQKAHSLYLVIETVERKALEAIKIDVAGTKDTVVKLPGLTEAVGVNYNPKREEVYIPYDNHPSVHVVDFNPLKNGETERVFEIRIPTYGNDASAVDESGDILYITSWGYGDVEVIDLKTRTFLKPIRNVGIIPHMFNITVNPAGNQLIIPIGATAVNGSFGSSLTVVDPTTEKMKKIYTGWAPVDLVEMKDKGSFMVFNSEDEAAEVTPDGTVIFHPLPCEFANGAIVTPKGNIYVSYGPHQAYWPVVYIWAAKNGILRISPDTTSFYDRRIPRMAQQMVLDSNGVLYALQNPWGREKQFIISLPDEIRAPNLPDMRKELDDTVERETTQRILKHDSQNHCLYIARVGERDEEPGILQIYDLKSGAVLLKYPTGKTPTDLVFDASTIYISNFDSDTVTAVNKTDFSVQKLKTGEKPFKLALLDNVLYCLNHNGQSLQAFGGDTKTYPLPFPARPSALFASNSRLIVTAHTANTLYILSFSPAEKTFTLLHKEDYPFGETTVDTDNSAFYLRGQFGDGIFELNRITEDKAGRLWITDYLSGKLFIISSK
jgi:DNA-binding beta-propeller fold protein YncE